MENVQLWTPVVYRLCSTVWGCSFKSWLVFAGSVSPHCETAATAGQAHNKLVQTPVELACRGWQFAELFVGSCCTVWTSSIPDGFTPRSPVAYLVMKSKLTCLNSVLDKLSIALAFVVLQVLKRKIWIVHTAESWCIVVVHGGKSHVTIYKFQ